MVISGGNVGIGTATPSSSLHVYSAANSFTGVEACNSNASGTGAAASHGTARNISRFGVTLGGYGEMATDAGNGRILGTRTQRAPCRFWAPTRSSAAPATPA